MIGSHTFTLPSALAVATLGCAQHPAGGQTTAAEDSGTESRETGVLGSSVVSGRVTSLEGVPVTDLFVSVSDEYCVPGRTSHSGEFLVEQVNDGPQRLITYGETATNGDYASVVFPVVVGGDTALAETLLVPSLTEKHPINLDSSQLQTVVSTEGLELDIEPGALTLAPFFEPEVLVARVLVEDAPPFVPEGVDLVDLHVLHPIRSTFEPPARLRLPANPALPPGSSVKFHSLDYDTGQLVEVASGTVGDDGIAATDEGQGIPELTWIGVSLAE